MESRILKGIFLVCAILYPTAVFCQSRGETYRGERPSPNTGYLQQSQAQLQSRSYPEYYQQQSQSQSQSYLNPPYNAQSNYNPYQNQPARYPQFNSQSPSNIQQFEQNHNRPAYVAPAPNNPYIPRPATPQNYNNYQSQPSSNLANRFSQDEVAEVFTNRPTKATRLPVTTVKPPSYVSNRFDDRGHIKKLLTFDKDLSQSMEVFALSLMNQVHARHPDENFMISPFSIYHLLVLIAEGAGGKTYDEIYNQLNLISPERTRDFQQYLNVALNQNTADVILRKFSMLVTDKNRPVDPNYESTVEKVYETEVEPVNFLEVDKTLNFINGKVSNLTNGQIRETVLKEDLFKAQLILLSGIFFQGQWMNVFNKTFTKQEPFYDTDGNLKGNVNMMFQRGAFAYSAVANLSSHVIELPYAEQPANRNDAPTSGLSMILVLPRKGLPLEEAIRKVHQFGMETIYRELRISKMDYEEDEVEVHIPRFEITTSFDMIDSLEGLDIKEVFDQSHADLSKINNQYFVSAMIHKTKIAVDEKGTTASAVTTSIFANKATPPKFHANKPFLFFIVDKTTKLILFSGQYANPELF